VRSQFALASKGNGPAQRAVIAMVEAIESECAAAEAAEAEAAAAEASKKPMSLIDGARRVAFLLQLANREIKAKREAAAAAGEPPVEPTPEDLAIEEYCREKW
jgi:flagellar biosynthesis/type III secretory pathway ATPase